MFKKSVPVRTAESAKFHMAVGYCITAWADLEEQLFKICAKSLGSSDVAAAVVYYRTPTLDGRLKLCDELVRIVLPPKTQKVGGKDHPGVAAWKKLRKRAEDLLRTRSRIAHHPVNQFTISIKNLATGKIEYESSELENYVSKQEQLRGRSAHLRPLLLADIEDHHVAVRRLARSLERFYNDRLPKHAQ